MKKTIILAFALFGLLLCGIANAYDGISVSLTWETTSADLDIHLVNPDGESCSWDNSNTTWGAQLDYDSWGGLQSSDVYPYEEHITVDWDSLQQQSGIYKFKVHYYEWGGDPSIAYPKLTIRYHGSIIYNETISISPGETKSFFEFPIYNNSSVSISNLSYMETSLNRWQISGLLVDQNGNPVSNYTIGVHDSINLQSTTFSTNSNGEFSYITYRSFSELPSGIYQIEFLDGQEILEQVQIITDGSLITDTNWSYGGVNTYVFECQLSNSSNNPITTTQLYSNMLFSESTPSVIFESNEEKEGFLRDLTDNYIDGFIDASLSWSDVGFYVITGAATGAACYFSAGTACPAALSIAAHAIGGHVAVDNIELLANSGNDAALENGYIDETQNAFLRKTIVGGKVVYSVITLSHDVGSHAANFGDVVSYSEHVGFSSNVMVGTTWSAYNAYNDAMGAVGILEDVISIAESTPEKSAEDLIDWYYEQYSSYFGDKIGSLSYQWEGFVAQEFSNGWIAVSDDLSAIWWWDGTQWNSGSMP